MRLGRDILRCPQCGGRMEIRVDVWYVRGWEHREEAEGITVEWGAVEEPEGVTLVCTRCGYQREIQRGDQGWERIEGILSARKRIVR